MVKGPDLRRNAEFAASQFLDSTVGVGALAFHHRHDDVVAHCPALVANAVR